MAQELAEDPVDLPAHMRRTSADTEHALLGCLLLGQELPPGFSWGDLAEPEHRLIYRAVADLLGAGKPVDVFTVNDRLQTWGAAEKTGGLEFLQKLHDCPPPQGQATHYAELIHERAETSRQRARRQEAAERLAKGGDLAEVRAMLDKLETPASNLASRFPLLTRGELQAMPPLSWRVRNLLPTTGVAAIFGPKGSAKSFLVLDLLAAIGEGQEWFGYRVKAGRSLYIGLEAPAGIRLRVQAWERANERSFPDCIRFQFKPFNLTEREDVLALAAAVDAAGGVEIIVIDTLNRASSTVDENSSEGMGRILDGATMLQAMTGSLVVLVHHTGKDASKGMRGHSSLIGALDGAIEAVRDGTRREWKVDKVKDGEDGAVHPFRLMPVDLGYDDEGDPLTSCVVMPPETDEDAPQSARGKLPKGGNQKIVYDALGPLLRASATFGRAGAPAVRPCILLEDAVNGTKDRLAVDPRRRGERARQAITGLVASGVVGVNEGWLWLV